MTHRKLKAMLPRERPLDRFRLARWMIHHHRCPVGSVIGFANRIDVGRSKEFSIPDAGSAELLFDIQRSLAGDCRVNWDNGPTKVPHGTGDA